jgi:hypothetical protein
LLALVNWAVPLQPEDAKRARPQHFPLHLKIFAFALAPSQYVGELVICHNMLLLGGKHTLIWKQDARGRAAMPTDSADLYRKNADDCRERSLGGIIAQVPPSEFPGFFRDFEATNFPCWKIPGQNQR